MASGGYRRPSGPQPPSGPGKFSTRQDGNQPPATPPLHGSDLQSGDVGRLRDAQAAVPIPNAGSGAPANMGPPVGAGPPPGFLFGGPSTRPDQPGTAGMPMGPGPGPEILPPMAQPDDREVILQFLMSNFQNDEAGQMLQNIREERAQAAPTPAPVTPDTQSPDSLALPPPEPQQLPQMLPPSPDQPPADVAPATDASALTPPPGGDSLPVQAQSAPTEPPPPEQAPAPAPAPTQ